jgi:tRNA nucleotidyltransferase (CCA-adding enzyme)
VGRAYVNDLFRLRIADRRARDADPARRARTVALWRRVRGELAGAAALEIGDLAIGGQELRQLGLPPGPLYGEILRDLLDAVTDDPSLNQRERLMEMLAARISGGEE